MNEPDELHEDAAEFLRGAMKALPADPRDLSDDDRAVLSAIAAGLGRRETEHQLAIIENDRERHRLETESGLLWLANECLTGYAERAGIQPADGELSHDTQGS